MKRVVLLEGDYLNTYIVRVIKETENLVIGDPVRNQNKRIRVNKESETAELLPDSDLTDMDTKEYEVDYMDENIPSWFERTRE